MFIITNYYFKKTLKLSIIMYSRRNLKKNGYVDCIGMK
jgi:hypothetical protein